MKQIIELAAGMCLDTLLGKGVENADTLASNLRMIADQIDQAKERDAP